MFGTQASGRGGKIPELRLDRYAGGRDRKIKGVLFDCKNDYSEVISDQNRLPERKPEYQMAGLTPGPDQTAHGCNKSPAKPEQTSQKHE